MKRSRMGKQRSDRFLLARGCGIRRSAASRSGKTSGRDSRAACRFRVSPGSLGLPRTNTGIAPFLRTESRSGTGGVQTSERVIPWGVVGSPSIHQMPYDDVDPVHDYENALTD
jgi:hypothetical protein